MHAPQLTTTTLEVGGVEVHMLNTSTLTPQDFEAALPPSTLQHATTAFKSKKRQTEWLGVRLLLRHLMGAEVSIGYEPSGAPFLKGSDKQISISHSGDIVALVISNKRVGMDVQGVSDKPLRLKGHFLADEEQTLFSPTLTALDAVKLWCAKEAVYKYLSIPETPLIGGICLAQKDGLVVETNHGLRIHFHTLGDAVFAVACKH